MRVISISFNFLLLSCHQRWIPPSPTFFFAITCFFCNHFQELQTVLFEVELIINNKPLRWLVGLKLIQLEQQKMQLPFIILAKTLKSILCRVIEGT